MKIALTGTTGVVGETLLRQVGQDETIDSAVILAPPVAAADLAAIPSTARWPVLANWEREPLISAIHGCDALIHCTSVEVRDRRAVPARGSWHNPHREFRACAWHPDFVLRFYDAAAAAGVGKFVLIWDDLMQYSEKVFRSSAEIVSGVVLPDTRAALTTISRRIVIELIRRRLSTTTPPSLIIVADFGRWGYDREAVEVERAFLRREVWDSLGVPGPPEGFELSSRGVDASAEGVIWALRDRAEGIRFLSHK